MQPINQSVLHAIMQERRVAYAITDRELRVNEFHGSIDLAGAGGGMFYGRSLLELVPELIGCEELLDDILKERLPRFELARINRKAASGRKLYLRLVSLPYRDERGQVLGLLQLIEDVTDAGQTEQRLSQQRNDLRLLQEQLSHQNAELTSMNAQLERAVHMREEFMAMMSHELRTPLTSILGMSEALQRHYYGPLSDEQYESLRTIIENGNHLLELINDILDYARVEADRLELSFSAVAVDELCQSALRMVAPIAQKKQIEVLLQIHPEAMALRADERRLKQILVNLLGNAVKFTAEGRPIGLEVSGDTERRIIQFMVWDTGIGIAEGDIERMFQPFVQLDSGPTRQHIGSGLGLALVQRLVKLHGGIVTVVSAPGEGSRFTVTLPWNGELDVTGMQAALFTRAHDTQNEQNGWNRVRGASSAAPALFTTPAPFTLALPSPEDLEMDLPGAERQSTVLIVDDDVGVRETLAALLGGEGYQLAFSGSGSDVLELAAQVLPDLILLDVMLPGVDGFALCRRIRADARLGEVPIVMITALDDRTTRLVGFRCGADDFISKPFDGVELAARVRTITQLNRYRRLLSERARSEAQLQRFNVELTQAYDATIEGWSLALDLRDHETEGHCRRVTDLTVQLAEQMGVPEDDLIHIRRGALLHDIGKIGVPDYILHKPGPLTDEEREILKRHPLYAYQMLAPISYLRPALDIPYYHHEKWDGSGYPSGLKGDKIPLAARIFAVVDVYDALRSDRPYRNGWPEEQVREYLRQQAGLHFDPEIVAIFLQGQDAS